MTHKQRIGLIGVGLMGHGIAYNLLRHGHELTLLDHPGNQPLDELLHMGARTADSARAVAEASEVIIVCVTGSPQVEAVVTGDGTDGGVLQGLAAGSVVIDCSTSIPASTRMLAAKVEAAGGGYADAAMTRTAEHARQGRLNLLVGASRALLARIRPVLDCFAENVVHAGPVGAGHEMKLLHNFVSLGSAVLLAEAAACASRSGVDAQVFVDILEQGGGGGIALQRMKPFILEADPNGLPFHLSNAHKDLSYYLRMATDAGAASTMARATLDTTARGLALADGPVLVPELIRLLERDEPV